MFKIQEKGKPETAIWLVKEDTIIANDGSGDLQFDATTDDIAKIKVELNEDEKVCLSDLTFNQQIFINDQPIPPGSKRTLKHADTIQIGKSFFEIVNSKRAVSKLDSTSKRQVPESLRKDDGWKLKATGNWLDGQEFEIKTKAVLGRDSTCDLTIPGSHLSRRHVELIVTADGLSMKDLGSANGSYHNGKRVQETVLKDGDEVKFDILTFKVVAPNDRLKSFDKKRTVQSDVINLPAVDGENKSWANKPTSVGNQKTESDIILANHLRNKKIIYTVFAALLGSLFISIVLMLTK